MKKLLLICLLIFLVQPLIAQVSTPVNNGGVTDYVGWDINQTFPLTIKHEATQPINFYTSAGPGGFANMRMNIFEDQMLAPSGTSYNVGRVGIHETQRGWNTSTFPIVPIDPASLLHIGEGWPRGAGGHRLWMDVGTFALTWNDHLYVGLKQQVSNTANENQPWNDNMDA